MNLARYFHGEAPPPGDLRQVIVFNQDGRSVGLEVGEILDIVSERVAVQRRTNRPGVSGSAVIQSRVTDLVDVPAIVRAVDPGFFSTEAAA